MKSKYVLQFDPKTLCPVCDSKVNLLIRRDGNAEKHSAFYICFICSHVAQVGVGPVEEI